MGEEPPGNVRYYAGHYLEDHRSNFPVAYEPLSDNIYSKTNYFRVPFNRMHVVVTVFVFPNVYELICKDVNCDGDI